MLPRITRVILVLDGAGVGAAPDAAAYGDAGANTLGHVLEARSPRLPNLMTLGLGTVLGQAGGPPTRGACGRMAEQSAGKDTTVGHWELAGVVTRSAFPTYPEGFPPEVIEEFARATGRGVIGNRPASGTEIIKELCAEHARTGSWIVYTSADSVFQVAAHHDVIPTEELHQACEAAARMLLPRRLVLRVIARPFAGEPGHLRRTAGRRDYNPDPVGITALDRVTTACLPVVTIGKVDSLFTARSVTEAIHTAGNAETLVALADEIALDQGGLVFANLIDFDMLYGHRNDATGYAAALEEADAALGRMLDALGPRDLLIVTADHGCDPTTPGTDHTREHVPLLVCGRSVRPGTDLGTRPSFADAGATVCDALGLQPPDCGLSFWPQISLPAKVEPRRVAAARDRWYDRWGALRSRAG